MAYFHCLIGGGSSGGGYELTVTCDADFAGTTITATDGVTTLTQTCPSASPYEVVFAIPNGGDWTISGVVGGQTVSTGVNIPTSAELIATIQQTVTIHSAKEDTISYIDIDGATQTITFASGATSKQVQITINPNGSSITFTSSVAKNPNNLSQDYSKTFTITPSTTEIYLMPDAVKTFYWWGYESSELEDINTSNGWTVANLSPITPTRNKNNLYFTSNGTSYSGIASKTKKQISKIYGIGEGISNPQYGRYLLVFGHQNKNATNVSYYTQITSTNVQLVDVTCNDDVYVGVYTNSGNSAYLYALWYE